MNISWTRRRFLTAGTALLTGATANSRASMAGAPLNFVSEQVPALCESATLGLWPTLLHAVYLDSGYVPECALMPFRRGMSQLEQGQVDGLLAVYSAFIPQSFIPDWPVGIDDVSAFVRRDAHDWTGEAALDGKRVGWIRGYDYDQFFTAQKMRPYEVNNKASGLSMLAAGRIDVYLDNRYLVTSADISVALSHWQGERPAEGAFQVHNLREFPLFIAFHDRPAMREAAAVFDAVMTRLADDGRLESLIQTVRAELPQLPPNIGAERLRALRRTVTGG